MRCISLYTYINAYRHKYYTYTVWNYLILSSHQCDLLHCFLQVMMVDLKYHKILTCFVRHVTQKNDNNDK